MKVILPILFRYFYYLIERSYNKVFILELFFMNMKRIETQNFFFFFIVSERGYVTLTIP